MRKRLWWSVLVCGLIMLAGVAGSRLAFRPVNALEPTAAEIDQASPDIYELLRLTNAQRKDVGVEPLVLDPLLNQSALYKAKDMAVRDYFGHFDPESDRINGLDYAGDIGAKCLVMGENLTQNPKITNPQTSVNAWVNSPSHYAAMINPDYESTGFGVYGIKVVQHFCDVV